MMIRCRECNKEISDEARICPYCGCPSVQDHKMQKTRDANENGKTVLRVILGIALLVVGFLLLYNGAFGLGS